MNLVPVGRGQIGCCEHVAVSNESNNQAVFASFGLPGNRCYEQKAYFFERIHSTGKQSSFEGFDEDIQKIVWKKSILKTGRKGRNPQILANPVY